MDTEQKPSDVREVAIRKRSFFIILRMTELFSYVTALVV